MSATRPFRHLCPEADLRDAMTDDEFWERVASNLGYGSEDDYQSESEPGDALACGECGEVGACAYDSEGRALVHPSPLDDTT